MHSFVYSASKQAFSEGLVPSWGTSLGKKQEKQRARPSPSMDHGKVMAKLGAVEVQILDIDGMLSLHLA